jgi:uncharacterized RDD family membrane protein YckC
MEETTNSNILEEIQFEMNLEPVSSGVRFANYIIDLIVFYAIMFLIGLIWGVIALQTGTTPNLEMGKFEQYFLSIALYVLIYSIIEGVTKGRTVGKLVTGTVALKEDGSPITFTDALLRSLCRIIPFEPFSAFGYRPWHDKFSNTIVVKKIK